MRAVANWQRVPVSQTYLGLFDGPHATPKPSEEGPVFLGIGNISEDGRLDLTSIRHIAEEDFPRWTKRVEPKAGDIVFTYEATLNRYAIIPLGFRGCLGRRLALIRPDPTVVDTRFLHFYFFGADWRKTIAGNTLSGATVDRVPLTRFPAFPVNLPPLAVQNRIASILSGYDDLIENNTRRIAILDEMARRIYEEWFVHFRFPSHEEVPMVESVLGAVPEGWEIKEVKDLVRRLPSGRVYKQADVGVEGEIPVVDQSTSEVLGFHSFEPDHNASTVSPIVIFGDHTCKMQVMVSPFSLGPNTVAFTARKLPVHYIFALVNGLVSTHEYKRHWTDLMKKSVLLAANPVAMAFADVVKPMVELNDVLRCKNRNLRATRDLLLPKLISGELDVSDLPEPDTLAA